MQSSSTSPVAAADDAVLPGTLVLRSVGGDPRLRYYLYVPKTLDATLHLLVAVHGISRNSREHGRAFAREAEHRGVVVVAPEFTDEFYPDFQRLGIATGHYPDVALECMLADVERLLDSRFPKFALFGFSGGAQFAHRYAFTRPERVSGLALAAAGWYTWPRVGERFPFGLDPNPARPELRCDLERFLSIPLCVIVGAHDTRRDDSLRRTRMLDLQQGRTRLERASNWLGELVRQARERRLKCVHELRVLAKSDHDFLGSVRRDGLDLHVFDFLFAGAARHRA